MIKLETHCHVRGGSSCAHVKARTLVKEYAKGGYGAVTLTTHYCKNCYDSYPGDTHKQKIDYFLSLRNHLKDKARKYGLKVFTGAEVLAVTPANTYAEFMLGGFDDKLLYDTKPFFTFTQKELFEFADNNKIFMYQTHPFRKGVMTGDPHYMHGAEAFNGHANHNNCNAFAENFCDRYSLVKLSGTDYHDAHQPLTAGVFVPENIENERQLADFYFDGKVDRIMDKVGYEKEYALRHYGRKK